MLIPRITIEARDYPIHFKRKQFPVKLSYALNEIEEFKEQTQKTLSETQNKLEETQNKLDKTEIKLDEILTEMMANKTNLKNFKEALSQKHKKSISVQRKSPTKRLKSCIVDAY